MNLFVDDIREPFKGWHRASTITEAIRILATMKVDTVSLDHDIKQTVYGEKDFETFEPVARYIALMPADIRPKTILFHTGNPDGGRRMAEIVGVTYEHANIDYAETKNHEDF